MVSIIPPAPPEPLLLLCMHLAADARLPSAAAARELRFCQAFGGFASSSLLHLGGGCGVENW